MNLFFYWLLLCPPAVMLLMMVLGARRRTPVPSFCVPAAEETAESVRRFREAAERELPLDFAWENFSRGRALLIDDMHRRINASRPRRTGRREEILGRL